MTLADLCLQGDDITKTLQILRFIERHNGLDDGVGLTAWNHELRVVEKLRFDFRLSERAIGRAAIDSFASMQTSTVAQRDFHLA